MDLHEAQDEVLHEMVPETVSNAADTAALDHNGRADLA